MIQTSSYERTSEQHDQLQRFLKSLVDVVARVKNIAFCTCYIRREMMLASKRRSLAKKRKKLDTVLQKVEDNDRTLQKLDCGFYFDSWDKDKEIGALRLLNSLHYNISIKSLILEDNLTGYEGYQAISRALSCNTTNIQYLKINHSNLGDTGATAIAEGLRENISLLRLDLQFCSVGNKGAIEIAKALYKNAALQKLSIGFNKDIGDEGLFAFCKVLAANNETLQELNLEKCQIGNRGCAALGKALSTNRTLQILRLDYNPYDSEGIASFVKNLKNNVTLRRVNLYSFKSRGSKGAQQLEEAGFFDDSPDVVLRYSSWGHENPMQDEYLWNNFSYGAYYSWRAVVGIKSEEYDNRYPLHVAASQINWNCGLKNFVKADYAPLIKSDHLTGLYPFMLAATKRRPDLDAIYSLLRLNPGVIDIVRKG